MSTGLANNALQSLFLILFVNSNYTYKNIIPLTQWMFTVHNIYFFQMVVLSPQRQIPAHCAHHKTKSMRAV